MPRPRDDGGGTVMVRTMFIVRPDGSADTASVVIEGTSDPEYRPAMVRVLARQRFAAPTVHGCPAWRRGDIVILGVRRGVIRP
ncbi:MAG: hypothetical protein ABR499_16725 [Gemmatimonadaceae bacterium]